MAHLFDIIRQEMTELQVEVLSYFKNMINCEEAELFFVNERTKQLMMNYNGMWYRMPLDAGLVGHCALTGESINIADCYGDGRFNR